jgi:hypothetical protein
MSKKYVFSDSDYNSGDGMMTSVWGPPMWHMLHTISFNYPINPTDEQRKQYWNFYTNLQNILPCRYCRENLANNLTKLPLTMDVFKSRDTLSRYVYTLHETVNTMLGKSSGLCYEDVRDRYEHFRSRCLENPKKISKSTKLINNKLEKGCTEPLYGVKSKCVLNIVPRDDRLSSFKMDPKCVLKKGGKESSQEKGTKKGSKKGSKKAGSKKAGSKKAGSKKGSKK